MTTTTPNMGLVLPDPGSTIGPTWASLLNAALEAIDEHTHTSGSGVQVSVAGLLINANLPMNDYSLTEVGSVDLTNLSVDLSSGTARLYAYNGELYYRDDDGTNVRITLNGAVDAGATGAITGLTSPGSADYSTITETFTWTADTGEAAKMAVGDILLYRYGEVSPNPITIRSPASLASAYTIEMPAAVPAATHPVVMSSSGVLSVPATLGMPAGSASAPAYSFSSDTNTGLYSVGADQLGVATGGTLRLTLSTTALTSTVPYYGSAGSDSAPSITFSGDTNTGLYSASADTIGFTANGSQIGTWSGSALRGVVGTVSSPGFSFVSDTNTGMYGASADNLGFATGGSQRLNLNSTGAQITGSLNINSGGAFKVTRYSGTVTTSGATLNPGATVYAAYGIYNNGGGVLPIAANSSAAGAASVYFTTASNLTSVVIDSSSGSWDYQVVVIHA